MKDMARLFEKTSFANGVSNQDVDVSKKSSREKHPAAQAFEVAIVGLGDWGQKAILSSLHDTPHFKGIKQFHLVAGENHTAVAARYDARPNMRVYRAAEYETLLKNPALSAVIISTPCHTHYEIAKAALSARKHVFVEKTFTLTEAHAAELITLAHQKGLKLMVGYEYMFDDAFSAVAHLIKARSLGAIRSLELHLFNQKKEGTAINEKYGTSIVNHHGTHLLSILQLWLGMHKIEDLEILEAEPEYLRLRMRYADVEVILATAVDLPNRQNYRTAIIHGTEKTIEMAFDGPEALFTVKKSRNGFLISEREADYPNLLRNDFTVSAVQREFEHFFECITQNHPTLSGGKTGFHLVKMTDQIERAYQEKMRETRQNLADEDRRIRQDIAQALDRLWLENADHTENAPILKALSRDQNHRADAVEATWNVVHYLAKKPYAPVSEIAAYFGLSHDALKVVYKLIQRVDGVRNIFNREVNYDYFHVVDRFFDRKHYEVTFFVGLSCPYKCTFCRMTMASQEKKEGYLGQGLIDARSLRFSLKKHDLLKYNEVIQVLEGLEDMRESGRPVTVKISGGLEPLSDPERVAFILEQSKKLGFPVRIYSNGILINNPDKRKLVLSCDDLRISLNALNEPYFQGIYRAGTTKSNKITYANIVTVLEELVAERTRLASKTLLGINYVVVKENIHEMRLMAALCREIGLDYVNFNTDYCDDFDDKIYIAIDQQIKKIKTMHARGDFGDVGVGFGGALLKQNVFTQQPKGDFDPRSMAQLKVFVDPAGEVTPVHEGTYPFRNSEGKTEQNPYVLGKLSDETTLQDLLEDDTPLAPIAFRYLAPFELILGLELIREAKDKAHGFTAAHSPYRRSAANLPLTL